ncbi:11197_t:CDS:1, partial [Funneliformis mosseae]
SHPEISNHAEGSVEQQQSKEQKEAVEREQQDPLESQQREQEMEEANLTKAALYLRRGHLLLTLIDQVKSVNLIFMENLLTKIKEFLKEERSDGKESDGSGVGLSALQKVLFDVLSNELDYTKKEFGVKWWLSEG